MALINNRRPLTWPTDDLWRDLTFDPAAAPRRVSGEEWKAGRQRRRRFSCGSYSAYSIRHV